MTPEQKAAYIFAQSVCALAEIEGMKALNMYRDSRGETIAYDDNAIMSVIDKYGIHHNGVCKFFFE
jgi:hypothetical protein